MKILVLDLETTVQKVGDKKDNSPFHPDNYCVSAHFGWLGWDTVDEVTSLVFSHNDQQGSDSVQPLQDTLNTADILVAHNAKFDLLWLTEMGMDIPPKVYCTMIGEYILAKGQKIPLSLKETSERRNVTHKKSDLVDGLFKKGIGFEAIPLETVIEYAEADVISCAEIYLQQQEDFARDEHKSLTNIVTLMNEMLLFLLEIERNGIQIDMQALSEVEQQFMSEKEQLLLDMERIVEEVMGDTPINLNSGADMTKVIYSRQVKDKALHKQVFNIGTQANGKPLRRPRMKPAEFAKAVRATTDVVYRTVAKCCSRCNGRGLIRKVKKDGNFYARENKCPECSGQGALYESIGKVAGLKLTPMSVEYAAINGFSSDKDTIKLLIAQARERKNLQAEEFLTKLSRLNAVSTYLDSFVQGIRTWTRQDGLLHTNFNQTVAATGRLSSSNPNFQNQPKGKFPIRKAVVSRFDGGSIIEADYSGLEFRVAGELSRDSQIIADVMNGKDIHKQTATIINNCTVEKVTKDMRQGAKAYSFAPLYGGMGATEPAHIQKYFQEFFVIYKGLAAYQKRLMDGVLRNGIVQTPSGRQYYWPNVRRLRNGRTSNATQIVNYPVQGFATGDIVPLACVRASRVFKRMGLRSLLILTVHDSIVVDCYPGERDKVCAALQEAMMGIVEEIRERWQYEMVVPLVIEISEGPNWLDQTEIDLPSQIAA